MPTPQKVAMRSTTIAEEPEEEDAAVSGARPQVLSASACQQVRDVIVTRFPVPRQLGSRYVQQHVSQISPLCAVITLSSPMQ